MSKIRLYHFLFILLCMTSVHAATLSTKVDPAQVMPGEAFHLTLELDENAPAGLPDFTPLQYDFQINGTSHRASYMFIDGQSKASSSWTVTLTPKRTGKLTIPAIQVGQARSEPRSIEVTNTPQKISADSINTAPASALFIQTKASESKPFINQQLVYTVKIYHNTSILDASYQPPRLSDALTIPLGENRQYQAIENGRPYLVEEQKYAFFPQQSGTHILFPPSFQALIYDDIPRRVRAEGKSASLEVKPIPEAYKNKPWAPAKSLALTEQYEQPITRVEEGGTLTRILTLRAAGLPAELLPPLDISKSTAFNVYPERPVLSTEAQGNDIIGKTTVKINYLFNQAGQVTLPEQTVTWFNTETGKIEHSTLPERILHVTARATTSSSPASDIKTKTQHAPQKVTPRPKTNKHDTKHALALHVSLLSLFVLFGLFSLFKYIKSKRRRLNKRRAFKALCKACLNNQPQAANEALFTWAKFAWPEDSILNLDDIAQIAANTELSKQIKILSGALYDAAQSAPWQGEPLCMALRQLTQKRLYRVKKSSSSDDLPPINPKH